MASARSSWPALTASLLVHALLAAAVAALPARAAGPRERQLTLAWLELLPPPPAAEPGERLQEPAASAPPALSRAAPLPRAQRALRQRAAAPTVAPTAVPSPAAVPLAQPPAAHAPSSPTPPRPEVASGEPIFEEGDVEHAPRLLGAAPPAYPAQALRQGREGDVVLTLVVDAAGSVREARVLRTAGRGFDEAALAAARGLRFQPGRKGGRNVSVRVTWTCRFRLE